MWGYDINIFFRKKKKSNIWINAVNNSTSFAPSLNIVYWILQEMKHSWIKSDCHFQTRTGEPVFWCFPHEETQTQRLSRNFNVGWDDEQQTTFSCVDTNQHPLGLCKPTTATTPHTHTSRLLASCSTEERHYGLHEKLKPVCLSWLGFTFEVTLSEPSPVMRHFRPCVSDPPRHQAAGRINA